MCVVLPEKKDSTTRNFTVQTLLFRCPSFNSTLSANLAGSVREYQSVRLSDWPSIVGMTTQAAFVVTLQEKPLSVNLPTLRPGPLIPLDQFSDTGSTRNTKTNKTP